MKQKCRALQEIDLRQLPTRSAAPRKPNMGKAAAPLTNNAPKTSTHTTAITEHADPSCTKGMTHGMTEKGREWSKCLCTDLSLELQMVKLQQARERCAKEAEVKEAAQVKSQTQRKAIESMIAAGLSTEDIQAYLDVLDADSSDPEDGGESINSINEVMTESLSFHQFTPLATYSTSASQTLRRPPGVAQSSPIMSQARITQVMPGKHRQILSSPGPERPHRTPKTTSCNATVDQDNVEDPNRTHKRSYDDLTDTDTQTSTHPGVHQHEYATPSGNKRPRTLNSLEPGHEKQTSLSQDKHPFTTKQLTEHEINWEERGKQGPSRKGKLKENLHYNGRFHARLPILQDDPKPNFNMMKFSLAVQAIESSDED
ncbi:hypothetical protein JB92DRAFT_3235119 [Gautieria morchelliformis]|nr:hypothetical protein JB92DRAFT_3235119 [Gautieria morchelliformis]